MLLFSWHSVPFQSCVTPIVILELRHRPVTTSRFKDPARSLACGLTGAVCSRPLVSSPSHCVLTCESVSDLPTVGVLGVGMCVFIQQEFRSDSDDEQSLSLLLTFKIVDFPGTQLVSDLV